MLTRDQIFSAPDFEVEVVEVPRWGGSVTVRTLTAAQRDQFEASLATGQHGQPNMANVRARLCVLCIVDDAGHRIFSDEDAATLGTKSAIEVNKVFAVAQRLNGLTRDSVEALKKNFEPAPADASPSA